MWKAKKEMDGHPVRESEACSGACVNYHSGQDAEEDL